MSALTALTFFPWHHAAADEPWKQPFQIDEHTVALYHFDEGQGNETREANGDPELTLRANKQALWGKRPGFGATARFIRTNDDANLLIGPIDNDKLELRTCEGGFTIEAQVRYTGPYGKDWGNTYANICGTDEEGFSLPHGRRTGWNFSLHHWKKGKIDQLVPGGRLLFGPGAGSALPFYGRGTTVQDLLIADRQWHHVAWQFRDVDRTHFLYIDGQLFWKWAVSGPRQSDPCSIPFHVGGFLHSQDPPFQISKGNFEGEIDELRISSILRYPLAEKLTIVPRTLPDAAIHKRYSVPLSADGAEGDLSWLLVNGVLPKGLTLAPTGVIEGTATEATIARKLAVAATDAAGHSDEHTFTIEVQSGRLVSRSLPLAFAGLEYEYQLESQFMSDPVRWQIRSGLLPEGLALDSETGRFSGTPTIVSLAILDVVVEDGQGQRDQAELVLKVVPAALRMIKPDQDTVALWDWQGPSGKLIADRIGDEQLMLTWVNMTGDQRQPRAGWGLYPNFIGGGENGFVGPQRNDKVDLRTCTKEWTVEAWVRRGGRFSHYSNRMGKRHFDFGHICGTYDNSKRGVWELYLSDHDSPDGSMAPGVHFFGAEPEQALNDLHPWKRPEGIVGQAAGAGIHDTQWHHVAWQYDHSDDMHEIFLDGKLIWKMASPDGRRLVNNRRHDAQFSVGSRLTGYARYGGAFNWLGRGNFFGQIGEIRISNIRRYLE